ncbi:MAG: class I SAM-dependent methyltransferase [Methanomicrobiales archaeon]|nr:class I SAM-dependent methyltransferase [Methanomicrobiales archaeon]
MRRIIDWNELWKAIHASSPGRSAKDRDPAAIWDKRAAAYRRVTRDEKRATEQELAILDLRPDDTVLDVGAGTGRLAVPVAGTVTHVTALDPSGGMLSILRERMAAEGRTNYTVVQRRWEDVVVGRDLVPCDVVIAAYSLGFYDLATALRKFDAASRRSVYLFWHAGEWRSHAEMDLYRTVLGEEEALQKGYPDYIYPVNILHDAGIFPNVRIFPAIWDSVYDSVEEAVRTWVSMHAPDQTDLSPIQAYFTRVLRKNTSGAFVETTIRPTAAVWWVKGAE